MICVKSLLLASDFVTALPVDLFATEIGMGVLEIVPIRWHGGTLPIGFTLREHGTVTPAMNAFIAALRDVGKELA